MEGIRKIEGPAFTAPELAAGLDLSEDSARERLYNLVDKRNPLDEKARSPYRRVLAHRRSAVGRFRRVVVDALFSYPVQHAPCPGFLLC